jgi:hypothetical protein
MQRPRVKEKSRRLTGLVPKKCCSRRGAETRGRDGQLILGKYFRSADALNTCHEVVQNERLKSKVLYQT